MTTETGYVAVESAARIAGISARTLRYWIASGKLPATGGKRGRLVRLADVETLAAITGRTNGNGKLPADSATAVTGNVAEVTYAAHESAALTAIERQLADYREMIERLHRENVSLAGQLGKALGQVEELRAALTLLQAPKTADPAPDSVPTVEAAHAPDSGDQTPQRRPWWAWWRRLSPGVSA